MNNLKLIPKILRKIIGFVLLFFSYILSFLPHLIRNFLKIINEKQPLSIKDLAINGRDLIDLGIVQGKEIGEILNKLLDIVLEDSVMNERKILLNMVGSLMESD